jgi:hypothetical protein
MFASEIAVTLFGWDLRFTGIASKQELLTSASLKSYGTIAWPVCLANKLS